MIMALPFFFVAIFIVVAVFYKPIVHSIIKAKLERVGKRFELVISTKKIDIHSPLHYTFVKFSARSITRKSPSIEIDSIDVHLALGPLFIFSTQISESRCSGALIRLGEIERLTNHLWENKKVVSKFQKSEKDFSAQVGRIFSSLQTFFAKKIILHDVKIEAQQERNILEIDIKDFELYKGRVKSYFFSSLNRDSSYWLLDAEVPKNESGLYKCQLTSTSSDPSTFPPLAFFTKGSAEFTSLNCAVELAHEKDERHITVYCKSPLLKIFHPRVSSEKLPLRDIVVNLHFKFTPSIIEIDTTSSISLNNLRVVPYCLLDCSDSLSITCRLLPQRIKAQQLLRALPPSVFSTLEGLELSGTFNISLDFTCDFRKIDSLTMDYNFIPRNVKILSTGKSLFSTELDPYTHSVKIKNPDGTSYFRTLYLDSRSKKFINAENMPRYIVSAILTREDPIFFQHKGVMKTDLREAMIDNIKMGKFYRGASTITMQWIKNLFLGTEKTLCRKVEEFLIANLIEHLQWTTKVRIFEMYINLIEWAPNVYGLYEASQFYFGKPPGTLTLEESIFLATIIPSPGKFYTHFDTQGNYKLEQQMKLRKTAKLMYSRNLISLEEYENINPDIKIKFMNP